MTLAEALMRRSRRNARVEKLKPRAPMRVCVQEGDKPPENSEAPVAEAARGRPGFGAVRSRLSGLLQLPDISMTGRNAQIPIRESAALG